MSASNGSLKRDVSRPFGGGVAWPQRTRSRNKEETLSQTGGRLLADRSLSRLLGDDWPKSLDELEEMKTGRAGG